MFTSSSGWMRLLPPPVPPPLMPKMGPSDGSLRVATTFLPSLPIAWVSPTVVVVLPSPAGRRRDACHDDHLAASAVVADGVEGHLRLVVPIGDYVIGTQPKLLGNIYYRAHGSASLPCFLRSLPDSDSQDQSQHTSTDTVICPISYDANCSIIALKVRLLSTKSRKAI